MFCLRNAANMPEIFIRWKSFITLETSEVDELFDKFWSEGTLMILCYGWQKWLKNNGVFNCDSKLVAILRNVTIKMYLLQQSNILSIALIWQLHGK